jgi:hypothetical protein
VIVTLLPISPGAGVYVNEKGEADTEPGLTEPAPSSVIVALVAVPPNVFPLTVTAVVPHVVPVELVRLSVGPFTHPHTIWNEVPVVMHPTEFLTETV